MQTVLHESALTFLARVQPTLGHDERAHHLVLGVANTLAPATYLTIERDDELHLAAIASPRRPLIFSVTSTEASRSFEQLANWMLTLGEDKLPRSYIADVPHAHRFADVLQRRHGKAPRLKMRQRLHALTAVSPIARSPGQLIPAAAEDVDLLLRWQQAFNAEALGSGEATDPEMRDAVARRVDEGALFLWVDGEPRSMAAWARPTRKGVAINSVYTPLQWRGRGYATSCVAALSQHMLECGKEFCVLYTDLANPTSNAIYAKIGYHPVSDSIVYELEASDADS